MDINEKKTDTLACDYQQPSQLQKETDFSS